jgi:hypothetical protein
MSKASSWSTITKEFQYTLVGIIASAFSFIIAFAWRDFIQASFEKFGVKKGEEFRANLIYTLIVTGVGILIIYLLYKWIGKDHEKLLDS